MRPSTASQPRSLRPRRDFDALEERRRKAATLFRQGRRQADVARALQVARQTVSRWFEQWREGGVAALRKAGRAGRKPKLSAQDLRRLERALLKGARANGYPTELWTLRRIAEVTERITSVSYHPGHVWRILQTMGWSRQRPARRAVERDEEKIQAWVKKRWPAVKKTPDAGGPGSYSRTKAASR
jgi:transposase